MIFMMLWFCFDVGSDEYVEGFDYLSIGLSETGFLFLLMQKLTVVKYFEGNRLALSYFLLGCTIGLH
jgi:hypothetical protein